MEKFYIPRPKEEFNFYKTISGTVIVVRKSDGKAWEFDSTENAGIYFQMLYNCVDGDESRITHPKPLQVIPVYP
jgi:hypothetical protein